jgi:hypothetical protein
MTGTSFKHLSIIPADAPVQLEPAGDGVAVSVPANCEASIV